MVGWLSASQTVDDSVSGGGYEAVEEIGATVEEMGVTVEEMGMTVEVGGGGAIMRGGWAEERRLSARSPALPPPTRAPAVVQISIHPGYL